MKVAEIRLRPKAGKNDLKVLGIMESVTGES